jgi:hypothetical protein
MRASLNSLIFRGVSDFLTVRVVGSGNSISGTSMLLFSEEGFIIMLLLIVFVFVELEVVFYYH